MVVCAISLLRPCLLNKASIIVKIPTNFIRIPFCKSQLFFPLLYAPSVLAEQKSEFKYPLFNNNLTRIPLTFTARIGAALQSLQQH